MPSPRLIVLLAAALACLAAATPAAAALPPGAQVEAIPEGGETRLKATLLADVDSVAPGVPFTVGLRFELDPGWHVYWRHSGQAGLPPRVSFTSEHVAVEPLDFPAPEVFKESDGLITTYGYEKDVLLLAPAQVRELAPGAEAELVASVNVLACATVCIPGKLTLTRRFPVTPKPSPADAATLALFSETRARVPRPAAELSLAVEGALSQSAVRPGDAFKLAVSVVACAEDKPGCPELAGDDVASFIPDHTTGIELLTRAVRRHPTAHRGLVIDVEGRARADMPVDADSKVAGVVRVLADGRLLAANVELPLARAAQGAAVIANHSPLIAQVDTEGSARAPVSDIPLVFLQMLFFAFLGGMILNLMPCVLPVLFIKIASVARLAHNDKKQLWREDAAYAAGVLATMLGLGLLVVLLRSFGALVGWGFQFQSPTFSALLAAVLVVFALNLFGVFEVRVGAAGFSQRLGKLSGLGRSFLEGVLMVVVATPCTAPFLGTAVGFALVRSPMVILAMFLAIGLGLTAPFVLITWVPGLKKLVPRPGAWMEKLKQALGFALLGTVVWLAWLVGRMSGVDGMARLLVFLVCVSAIGFGYGLLQRGPGERLARFGMVAAIFFASGMGYWVLRFEPAPVTASADDARWAPYSPAGVTQALDSGKPVFVDFTADWCITCKVNEAGVLARNDVLDAFREKGFVLLRADWTQRDDTIRDELLRFGKAGVPMYLVYGPTARQGIVLPEVLTPGIVLEALERATAQVAARP